MPCPTSTTVTFYTHFCEVLRMLTLIDMMTLLPTVALARITQAIFGVVMVFMSPCGNVYVMQARVSNIALYL